MIVGSASVSPVFLSKVTAAVTDVDPVNVSPLSSTTVFQLSNLKSVLLVRLVK